MESDTYHSNWMAFSDDQKYGGRPSTQICIDRAKGKRGLLHWPALAWEVVTVYLVIQRACTSRLRAYEILTDAALRLFPIRCFE